METNKPLPFVIPAADVQALLSASSLSIEAFLSTLVSSTKALARPPISRFFVGAVALGSSGRVFLGVNLEFVGLPLSSSVHAEQFLVANAAQHGELQLRLIAVSHAPCGHCRQFLQELRGAPDLPVLIADEKAEQQTLGHFLPHRFGPNDVLKGDFPLLLEPRANGLYLKPEMLDGHAANNSSDQLCAEEELFQSRSAISGTHQVAGCHDANRNSNDTHDLSLRMAFQERSTSEQGDGPCCISNPASDLKLAALEAANRSHAPYTDCPSGIALLNRKRKVFSGSYMESVAHNPSLPPLQAALVAFVSRDGGSYEDIIQAVLVEREEAVMQFAAVSQLLLQKISPSCIFHVYHALKKQPYETHNRV